MTSVMSGPGKRQLAEVSVEGLEQEIRHNMKVGEGKQQGVKVRRLPNKRVKKFKSESESSSSSSDEDQDKEDKKFKSPKKGNNQ